MSLINLYWNPSVIFTICFIYLSAAPFFYYLLLEVFSTNEFTSGAHKGLVASTDSLKIICFYRILGTGSWDLRYLGQLFLHQSNTEYNTSIVQSIDKAPKTFQVKFLFPLKLLVLVAIINKIIKLVHRSTEIKISLGWIKNETGLDCDFLP